MPKLDAANLQRQLREIDAAVHSATALLQEKAFDLAAAPDSPVLLEHVQRLEAEIDAHRRNRGRIEASLHELSKRGTAEARRQRLAELAARRREVQDLGKRLAKVSEQLLSQVEALGPVLAEIEALGDERRAASSAILREGIPRDLRGQYLDAAAWRSVPLSTVLAAALWRCGLGRVGADLDPWLSLAPPREKADRYLRGELLTLLAEDVEAAETLLERGLQQAMAAVEGVASV